MDRLLGPAQGLRVLHFDDGAMVFDPVSWDAHLLNPAAAAVLDLLVEAPRSAAQIEAFLADALLPAEQVSAGSHARGLIADLLSLGLVRTT